MMKFVRGSQRNVSLNPALCGMKDKHLKIPITGGSIRTMMTAFTPKSSREPISSAISLLALAMTPALSVSVTVDSHSRARSVMMPFRYPMTGCLSVCREIAMQNAMFFPNRILYREELLSTTVTYAVDLDQNEFSESQACGAD